MRTSIPEKIIQAVDEIERKGSAPVTRLTALKKWFEEPARLRAFGLWIAKRAAGRKGKTSGQAGELLNEARRLLGTASTYNDMVRLVDVDAARELHVRAKEFQNTYANGSSGAMREIQCWPLFLVESGLKVYLGEAREPSDGYHLAVSWAMKNPAPPSEGNLKGSSKGKLDELVRFMFSVEALEDTADFQEMSRRTARAQ